MLGVVLVDGPEAGGSDAYRTARPSSSPWWRRLRRCPITGPALRYLPTDGQSPRPADRGVGAGPPDAIRLGRELLADFPDEIALRDELASSQYFLGCVLAAAQRYQEAENALPPGVTTCSSTGPNPANRLAAARSAGPSFAGSGRSSRRPDGPMRRSEHFAGP